MADKPKILFVGNCADRRANLTARIESEYDIVEAETPLTALTRMASEAFDGIYVDGEHLQEAKRAHFAGNA